MNLRSKIVIITLMAVVAIVGVGYATWTFNTEATGNVDVTATGFAAIEANNVQVKNATGTADVTVLYIVCEKPGEGGIYWSTAADGSAKITQIKLIGVVNEDDNDKLDFTKYTGTFTCDFAGDNTLTYFNIPAISINEDVESASKNANVEYLYTLPTLSYKDAPESVAEVNEMLAEVNNKSIEITFSFAVKSVTPVA